VAQAYGVFHDQGGFANRGTFVIDKNGVIRFAQMLGRGESRDQKPWREALAEITL
jgi:peroxiredoxin (alkyl hydroperoxide reductase subunit C)